MEQNQQKEKIERKISLTSEELFDLKKCGRSSDEEFRVLRTKLMGLLCEWSKLVFGKERVENAGEEIAQCIALSIDSFDCNEGRYINYISAALKKEVRRASERKKIFESSVVSFPEKKRQKLIRILHCAEEYGKDLGDSGVQKKLAELYGGSPEEINKLLHLYSQSRTIGETKVLDDGEEISFFDEAAAQEWNMDKSEESSIIEKNALENAISTIDSVFCMQQDRTKAYLSALVTHRILSDFNNAHVDLNLMHELLQNRNFTKTKFSQKVIESFFSQGDFVTQKEVASWFKKDDTDASRTLRRFSEKCQLEKSL